MTLPNNSNILSTLTVLEEDGKFKEFDKHLHPYYFYFNTKSINNFNQFKCKSFCSNFKLNKFLFKPTLINQNKKMFN